MGTTQSIRTALIGAGPRGTSVLERLLAHWSRLKTQGGSASGFHPSATLHIHVIDPYPPGPGHVWQPGQSRLYLMNTQSFYPTVIPEDPELVPPVAGRTFDHWRTRQQEQPLAGLTADERAELAALGSRDFPSRALYGRYLSSTLQDLLAASPDGVTVDFHRTTATAARRAGKGAAGEGTFDVDLADGGRLTVDSVVLALGHLESRLNAEQRELQSGAGRLKLLYLPPAAPADVDWSAVPAGQPVLVRGMGLNFFDVMGQLTEGRGGKFVEAGTGGRDAAAAVAALPPGGSARTAAGRKSELEYVPSGDEPLIIAASRRGTPYRAKANLSGYYASAITLRYLTESAVERFAATGIVPGFDHDLWPLLHRDTLWAYYSTLAGTEPGSVTDSDGFLASLQDALHPHAHSAANWEDEARTLIAAHVRPDCRLDLLGLAAPLAGCSFASREDLDAAVVDYLLDDARRSALGESDPVKMAIGALHHGRAVLKSVVADGGITDESWVAGLRGWFESFVEGLASGPPALRAEQLAALARAGVVSFVGPDPKFWLDRKTGLFSAASPWVRGEAVQARSMIEALAPANRVGVNVSPLLEQLLADGLVRARLMMTAEGVPVETTGLDVRAHPYRPVGANGSVTEGMYVLGLQLSAAQWGTAIAAEARQQSGPVYRSGQRTLRDADEIARGILGL